MVYCNHCNHEQFTIKTSNRKYLLTNNSALLLLDNVDKCMRKHSETDAEGGIADETHTVNEDQCINLCLTKSDCRAAVFQRTENVKICRLYSSPIVVEALKLRKRPTTLKEEFQLFEKLESCDDSKKSNKITKPLSVTPSTNFLG